MGVGARCCRTDLGRVRGGAYLGRAGAATWQGMCWTCALLTFALLTFALRMCRRFSTRGLIIWCVLCRHAQRLAKNDVDTRRRHLLLARMPPLCPRACTRGAFDAVPLLTLRLEDPNFFLTRNPILARMPPSPHACTKRCTRFCVTSHIASGATHEKSAPGTHVPLSVLSPRDRARLGSTSPLLEGTGPVIVRVLRLLRTDFSLRRLIAGMLLDRRLVRGS